MDMVKGGVEARAADVEEFLLSTAKIRTLLVLDPREPGSNPGR